MSGTEEADQAAELEKLAKIEEHGHDAGKAVRETAIAGATAALAAGEVYADAANAAATHAVEAGQVLLGSAQAGAVAVAAQAATLKDPLLEKSAAAGAWIADKGVDHAHDAAVAAAEAAKNAAGVGADLAKDAAAKGKDVAAGVAAGAKGFLRGIRGK